MSQELVDWLIAHYGREQFEPGLDRIHEAIAPLIPQLKRTRIITIAGTNGKGETTLRLSQLLGKRPHCVWTSPHILRLSERFRSEEGEIESRKLQNLIQSCHEQCLERKLSLSFYEFLFFVFCSWVVERSPEILLLEVGLGGRMDAVNVLDAELVLLPSISRDHQEFLGNRFDLILKEKLGVLRSGATLISFLELNYLRERAQKYCDQLGAQFIDLQREMPVPSYAFSLRNHLLASAAYAFLRGESIQVEDAQESLPPLEHRGEVLQVGSEWHLYGSHNVDGVRKLIQFLKAENYNLKRPPYDAVIVAFSQRNEQDLRAMLKMLKGSGLGPVSVVVFDHPKAASRPLMKYLTTQEGIDFVEHMDSIFQQERMRKVLVTGSYYFLGTLKSRLLRGHSAI